MSNQDLCRCGHERQAHQHYRAGSDCSLCPETCAKFVAAAPAWKRLLNGLRGHNPRLATPELHPAA